MFTWLIRCNCCWPLQEIVAWMGWKPWRITYASDYFQKLYEYAVQLIKSGNAFVCHQVGASWQLESWMTPC